MLELAFHIASKNWIMWRDVWTHGGPPVESPIFKENRFFEFINEYSVLRGIKNSKRKEVLLFIKNQENIETLIEHSDGKGISCVSKKIKERLQAGGQMSFSSKVAAFLKPDTFVASDKFSRDGVYRYMRDVAGHAATPASLTCYPTYLGRFNEIWAAEDHHLLAGLEALQGCAAHDIHDVRFRRRVLDVLLMLNGGRWRDAPHLAEQNVFPLGN